MAEPGERGAIVAMFVWLALSLAGIGVGYGWASDHGSGTLEPWNVGTIEVGTCRPQWTAVWHCEPVHAKWGEGRTPRDSTVHAGRDVSGRTVDVEWRPYRQRGTVVVATGPDAPLGNAAAFVGVTFGAAFSVAAAAVLVMVGRLVRWIRRHGDT